MEKNIKNLSAVPLNIYAYFCNIVLLNTHNYNYIVTFNTLARNAHLAE